VLVTGRRSVDFMRKSKRAVCAALVSLTSHPTILKIRSELEEGIENAFRTGFPFEFDNLVNAVRFDDLCFYFSPEHDRIILVFVYPGSTVPERLLLPGLDVPLDDLEVEEFRIFLDRKRIEFVKSELNKIVSTIKVNGSVFYFDLTCSDRRVDITNSSVAAAA
jgi:hypothetical protein